MKKLFFVATFAFFTISCHLLNAQNVAITDDPLYSAHGSAMLDVHSDSKGFLVPRLTTLQRTTISTPATGLLVFDTDDNLFYFFNGSSWTDIASTANSGNDTIWLENTGSGFVYLKDSTNKVGIGTSVPEGKLEVRGVDTQENQPLFVVKDDDGNEVFVVYSRGVMVYVDTADVSTKNTTNEQLTGFRVGRRTTGGSKGFDNEYFSINPATEAEIIDPSEARILWYPQKEAFMAGRVLVEHVDSVGTNSWASGFESKSIGDYSQALGYRARALGDYSTAVGNYALAEGDNSFALGDSAIAGSGGGMKGVANNSYAFGKGALALGESSYALGYGSEATGEDAFALGTGSEASGIGSFALGFIGRDSIGASTGHTKATNEWAVAIGMGAEASGKGSFSLGTQTLSSHNYATAMGYKTTASHWYATAIGAHTSATALGTTALGYYTLASSVGAVAMGYESTASGNYSIAGGYRNTASGLYSIVFGILSNAPGNNAVALGNKATAEGLRSFAAGFESHAIGNNAIAIGELAKTNGHNATAIGYNTNAIGIYGATAIGWETSTNNSFATAIGYLASAEGSYSMALNRETKAIGNSSLAAGHASVAHGSSSVALGHNVIARGNSSTAMGISTIARSYASFVVGRFNDTTTTSTWNWNSNDPLFIIGNGSANNERSNAMTVMKNGNVGIGSINPTSKLNIREDGSNIPLTLHRFSATTGHETGILFKVYGSTDNEYHKAGIFFERTHTFGRGSIHFATSVSTSSENASLSDARMTIAAGGNVGIGTTTPLLALHIKQAQTHRAIRIEHQTDTDYWEIGIADGGKAFRFDYNNTNVAYINNSTGAYTAASDIRLKKNIEPLGLVLNKVINLKPSTYGMIKTDDMNLSIGFISQEVEVLFPELVYANEEGYKFLTYDRFSVIAIKAIQEQQEIINTQQYQIEQQNKQLQEYEKRFVLIEKEINILKTNNNYSVNKD